MCVCVCVVRGMCMGACRGQKRHWSCELSDVGARTLSGPFSSPLKSFF